MSKVEQQAKPVVLAPKNLAEQIASVRDQLLKMSESTAKSIENGPDNPKIDRISPVAFRMSMADLGTKNWTPFFQDWKAQYGFLADLVREQRFGAVAEVISSGKLQEGNGNTERFAPEVVERLKEIVGNLPAALWQQDGSLAEEDAKPSRRSAGARLKF